ESCANCHDPHGSNHESMLKVAKPRLCQQCHIETRHPTSPYGRDTGSLKFVAGRAGVGCHSVIHRSNHPSGVAFTRQEAHRSGRSVIRLIALVLYVVAAAGVASAQTQLGGWNLEGEAEFGGRWYLDRPPQSSRAKLEEYRDLTPGPVLFGLNLRLLRPDQSIYGQLPRPHRRYSDPSHYLSVGSLGTWQFDFLWDQTPHIISTNARLLATEQQRGVFVLPTPRPALPLHNSAPDLDEISVRWDKAAMRFAYALSPNLDLTAEYTRIRKEGDKPMGMAFGSPGANFYEVLQPIEQTVHDFRLRGTYADPRYQL